MNADINKCLSKLGTGNLATDIKNAQSGGFTGLVKFVILVICVFVIITTISNIVAYSVILNNPEDEQNISTAWCITMAVVNGLLTLFALYVIFLVIKSLVSKDSKLDKLAADIRLTQVNQVNEAYAKVTENSVEIGSMVAADICAKTKGDAKKAELLNITKLPEGKTISTIDAEADAESKRVYKEEYDRVQKEFKEEYRKQLARATYANGVIFPGIPEAGTALADFPRRSKCSNGGDPPCGTLEDYEANLHYDYYNLSQRIGLELYNQRAANAINQQQQAQASSSALAAIQASAAGGVPAGISIPPDATPPGGGTPSGGLGVTATGTPGAFGAPGGSSASGFPSVSGFPSASAIRGTRGFASQLAETRAAATNALATAAQSQGPPGT